MADSRAPQGEHQVDWDASRARLRVLIRSHLGPCPEETLEDLTQEALVELLRIVRREGARQPGGLLVAVARSTAIDHIRWMKRQRARFAGWEEHLEKIVELPTQPPDDWEDSQRLLWFLLLEYFRIHRAPCLSLAEAYAENGDWRRVAEASGQTHDAARQQWSRCARAFREQLKRNPGRFREWLDDA